ncbi:hypothetical protein KC352_g26 [Hortaea werneckii]|nr:hypothetical protein KC352_g26 [Hortaea werneckii]
MSRHGYKSCRAYQRPPPAEGEGLGEDGHGCDGNRDDGRGVRRCSDEMSGLGDELALNVIAVQSCTWNEEVEGIDYRRRSVTVSPPRSHRRLLSSALSRQSRQRNFVDIHDLSETPYQRIATNTEMIYNTNGGLHACHSRGIGKLFRTGSKMAANSGRRLFLEACGYGYSLLELPHLASTVKIKLSCASTAEHPHVTLLASTLPGDLPSGHDDDDCSRRRHLGCQILSLHSDKARNRQACFVRSNYACIPPLSWSRARALPRRSYSAIKSSPLSHPPPLNLPLDLLRPWGPMIRNCAELASLPGGVAISSCSLTGALAVWEGFGFGGPCWMIRRICECFALPYRHGSPQPPQQPFFDRRDSKDLKLSVRTACLDPNEGGPSTWS